MSLVNWTERLRKFEEEEELKKLDQAAEQTAELNADRLDDAMQLFDKPGLCCALLTLFIFLGVILLIKVKVKASHTRYRALGPELIPVYRQSACR